VTRLITDQSTTCLQSQFGQGRHLRRERRTQVETAVALSVGVRWGPVGTAVNGTVVARPDGGSLSRIVVFRSNHSRGATQDRGDRSKCKTLRASARLSGSSDRTAPTTAMRKAADQMVARPTTITSLNLMTSTVDRAYDKVQNEGLSLSRTCLSRCEGAQWMNRPFRMR
jgi:hypothetical protein